MRDLENELKDRDIDIQKLIEYGFMEKKNQYIFRKKLSNEDFEMIVTVQKEKMISKVIDMVGEEEYVLVDIADAQGEFVGKIREEYEENLKEIIDKCTNFVVFKFSQTKEIIQYIRDKYQDELEFLWQKYDNNAIWRNKQNQKWYGLLVTLNESKLRENVEKDIEIINLRYPKEDIEKIIDNKSIFPAYHMNKKSWITVKLDESISTSEIEKLVDLSYQLTLQVKNGRKVDNMMPKMLEYLTKIPKNKVVTYKQVAEYLGNKGLARVVGNMLHQNPDGDKYPCYKVLNSKGELAENFVFGGKNVQKERLEKDGIEVKDDKVDLKKYQWR